MSERLKSGHLFAKRYRIDRFIAKGGFGVVYAAEQVDTEAKVALKIIWSHVIESEEALEQFKLEARLASRVGGDHVPRVFDVGRDPDTGRPYLAMELLEGVHFEELVRSRGPLPAQTIAEYFRQMGLALDRAHAYRDKEGARRPIVHRDLKPENLFLTQRDGGAPLVKILDFGLAKMVGDSAALSSELKGTPLFMAYEQASVGPVTPQTDIWTLGLIAFYLLTGRCYWLAGNNPESPFTRLFTEVLSAPLERASTRARRLSAPVIPTDAFDAWFARCVNRDSAKRFGTAGECVAELSKALDQTPRETTTPGPSAVQDAMPTVRSLSPQAVLSQEPSFPGRTFLHRKVILRRAVSVVFALMLVLLAGATLVGTQSRDERAAIAASPTPSPARIAGPSLALTQPTRVPPAAPTIAVTIATLDAGADPRPPARNARPRRASALVAEPSSVGSATTRVDDPYDHR
jgi:serine/threonine protein kinase